MKELRSLVISNLIFRNVVETRWKSLVRFMDAASFLEFSLCRLKDFENRS